MPERRVVQTALRLAAIAFVAAWLLAAPLQDAIPFWLPFAVLLATEAEFVVRAWRERATSSAHGPAPAPRRVGPSADDADLGWGELVEEGDRLVYLPPPPRPPSGRARRLLPAGLLVVTAVLFVVAARVDRAGSWDALPEEARARAEALFSTEASRIAGAPVTVRCDAGYAYTGIGSDALGVAFVGRSLALLEPGICRRLAAIALESDHRERQDSGSAVLVLAHEAVHLQGERDEGVTECRGLQEGVGLGERLGLERDVAARLMASLYARNLGERSITRLQYRLPEGCRDGGSLDLRPDDPRFP